MRHNLHTAPTALAGCCPTTHLCVRLQHSIEEGGPRPAAILAGQLPEQKLRLIELAAPPALLPQMDGRQQAAHTADALTPHALQPLQVTPPLAVRVLRSGERGSSSYAGLQLGMVPQ